MPEYNGATVRDYSGDGMPKTLTALRKVTKNHNALKLGDETMLRREIVSNGAGIVNSGTIRLTYFTANQTESISKIFIVTGGTAQTGATLIRMGIYKVEDNNDLTLVGSTANDTTLFTGTYTVYEKALEAPFTKIEGQRYALGIIVVTTGTLPSFYGSLTILNTIFASEPRIAGTVTSNDLLASIPVASVGNLNVQYYAQILP